MFLFYYKKDFGLLLLMVKRLLKSRSAERMLVKLEIKGGGA